MPSMGEASPVSGPEVCRQTRKPGKCATFQREKYRGQGSNLHARAHLILTQGRLPSPPARRVGAEVSGSVGGGQTAVGSSFFKPDVGGSTQIKERMSQGWSADFNPPWRTQQRHPGLGF